MTTIYDFPREWYDLIVTQTYPLRSLTKVAPRPFSGAGIAVSGAHTQLFLSNVTFAPQRDPVLQDIDAFVTRLRGRENAVRIAHAMRLAPWHDRNITPTVSSWSDGALFTDGSGFANGYLPPEVFVVSAAARGASYIVLGGFPASTSNVLRKGDPIEIKPNGIPAAFPHRYQAMIGGSSDADGQVGIKIEPRLHAGIAPGDIVGLRYAGSVFRMASDEQGDAEGTGAGIGNVGFSLVEALDLVP